jgi:hypothetical protein
MKRALIAVASVGILAVTVGVETADAQPYRRYGPARTYTPQAYTPQSRGSVGREGVPRSTPFSDPNSPEATAVVALATIESSRAIEKEQTFPLFLLLKPAVGAIGNRLAPAALR